MPDTDSGVRADPPGNAISDEARILAEEAFARRYNEPSTLAGCLADALAAAAPVIAAQAASDERQAIISELREFLPKYVTMITHSRTADGEPIYAAGPLAFPDALVDTFELMATADADLLRGAETAQDATDDTGKAITPPGHAQDDTSQHSHAQEDSGA